MKKDLRVLVVEDSEDDTHLLMHELRRAGFSPEFERVTSAATMTAALEEHPWDLVICDHSLPGFGSLEALKILQGQERDIPFIVVSGTMGEDVAVRMMKAGANDYVMKARMTRLAPSIERELREAESRRARRAAEAALQQKQRELEDFFEHAPLGLRWESAEGTILRVNEAELALLGYAQEDYVGHNIAEFHVDPAAAAEILRRLNAGETVRDYPAQLRCADGSLRDVIIDANALWEDGRLVRSRSFTRDITEQKRAQTGLAYLASIVESSEDAIIGKTLEGVILTWNSAAERMYGYTAEEVRGSSVSILLPAYRPDELPELFGKLGRGESVERHETVRVKKDGTAMDVSLTLSPIKDSKGLVVGISAIERDITERKREEEERLRLINELTDALTKIKTLKGLLPICSSCKKIRDDQGYWQRVESYITLHTDAEFTHGICPECIRKLYPGFPPPK